MTAGCAQPSPLDDLNAFVRDVVRECEPCMQNTAHDSLGFGWLYYGLIRNLRPQNVVTIGSRRGFMPFCAGRAVRDNGVGKVYFVDPGFSGDGHPGWSGVGFWKDPERVRGWIDRFGLTDWIEHLRMTSGEAFPVLRERVGSAGIGVVIIDGDHSYEGCLQDYENYASLITGRGFAVFHDAVSPWCDVPKVLEHLRARGLPMITLSLEVGMSIVEIRRAPAVEETWSYLVADSDRGKQVAEILKPTLHAGDRVLEMYCGLSPLPRHVADVEWWGYDVDSRVIDSVRRLHPGHRWEVVDERFVATAPLPEGADVLVGLGLVHGHYEWDARYALDNARYLVGRYAPRVCLFEAASEYYDADILGDLAGLLGRHGYELTEREILTDMASFARRKILLGRKRCHSDDAS